MKSIKRISVVFLLLFSIIINNTGGCAKVYNEWKHYYTFEGKLKRGKEQTTMNHGIEVTAFVLVLDKSIKVKTLSNKVLRVKKIEVQCEAHGNDYETLIRRVGKRIKLRGKLEKWKNRYINVHWQLLGWSFPDEVVHSYDTPKIVKLDNGITYKGYDITCNGNADSIIVNSKSDNNGFNTMSIVINGKEVFNHKEEEGEPEVHLLMMDEHTTLLEVIHWSINGYRRGWICSYKDSNWETVLDLVQSFGDDGEYGWVSGAVKEISRDSIRVNYDGINSMVGASSYNMDYIYTEGQLIEKQSIVDFYIEKIGSNEHVKNETMIANRKLDILEFVDNEWKVIYRIEPGDAVKFLKIQIEDGIPYFQVSVGNVIGTLVGQASNGSEFYFKDTHFYG